MRIFGARGRKKPGVPRQVGVLNRDLQLAVVLARPKSGDHVSSSLLTARLLALSEPGKPKPTQVKPTMRLAHSFRAPGWKEPSR